MKKTLEVFHKNMYFRSSTKKALYSSLRIRLCLSKEGRSMGPLRFHKRIRLKGLKVCDVILDFTEVLRGLLWTIFDMFY